MAAPTIIDYLGKVTQVIDPENFFMQIGTAQNLAEFLQFETTLEDFCVGKVVKPAGPDNLILGNLALVFTGQNETWRRGQITRIDMDKGSADVFFIDYGTTVLVDIDKLLFEFPEDFRDFPAQALKCCLAGIKPIAKSWPSRAIKRFQSMTDGEVFHAVIHCNQHGTFIVSLYNQDIGRSVAFQMLDEELGIPSDDVVFEMFVDVKDNFKTENQCSSEDYNEWYYDNDDGTEEDYSDDVAGSDSTSSAVTPALNHVDILQGSECASSVEAPVLNHHNVIQSSDLIGSTDMNHYGVDFGNSLPSSDEVSAPLISNIQEQNVLSGVSSSEDSSMFESVMKHNGEISNSVGSKGKSPDKIIPGFDFGQIHRTKNTSTGKLRDKVLKEEVIKLKEENNKIKEEMVEQSNMAVLAGYGGLEDGNDGHHNDVYLEGGIPPHEDQVTVTSPDVYETKHTSIKSASYSDVSVNEVQPGNDKKIKQRHGSGNSGKFQQNSDVLKSKSLSDFKRDSPTEFNNSTKKGGPFNLKTDKEQTRKHFRESQKVRRKSPFENEDSRKDGSLGFQENQLRSSTPTYSKSKIERKENIKQRHKIPLVTEMRDDTGQYSIYSSLTKIFQDSDKDTEDQTREKLHRLFSTDMYMYLEKEQLSDVITLVLNRAIRYYGEIHDAMLEIIETLESSEDFVDCLMKALKKMEDAYIKAHTTRSLFHTQCSKIVAHICHMSMHWGERANVVQEHVVSNVEKWILFNLKGTQTGKSVDKLQVIYLECFEVIWQIASTSLLKLFPDLQTKLKEDCKEKLFQPKISRSVKEKLLDVFINCFYTSNIPEVETVNVECQTETDTGDVPVQAVNQTQYDDFMHSIPDSKTMDLIRSLAENVSVPEWPSPDITKNITYKQDKSLKTPESFNGSFMTSYSKDSSAYFTPEETSWMSEFPPLTLPSDQNEIISPSVSSESHSVQKSQVAPPPGFSVTYPSWSQCVGTKTSPTENREKSPKRNLENRSVQKEQSYPMKSYSASRALLHDKPRADKSRGNKSKAGNSNPEPRANKSKSETTLQGIMKEMVESTRASQSEGNVTSDSEHNRLQANSTPDHWDDSFSSDQDNDTSENKTSKTDTGKLKSEKNYSVEDAKMEKKEQTDWWSLGNAEVNENAENATLNKPELLSSNIDKNENIIKVADEKSDKKINYDIFLDDDDEEFEWTTDSDDEAYHAIVVSKKNVGQNENPAEPVKSNIEDEDLKPKTKYAEPKAPSWRPGIRKCTICGETTHLIYNCPDRFKNGKGYFF